MRRRTPFAGLIAALTVAVLMAAACSSSSTGTSSGRAGLRPAGLRGAGVGQGRVGRRHRHHATAIRIAMIADVDTTLVPGLFQKSVNAVKAWASSVNASGGLDGRKVVVGGQVRAIVSGRVPTRAELDRKVSFTVRLLVDGLRSRRDDTEKAP